MIAETITPPVIYESFPRIFTTVSTLNFKKSSFSNFPFHFNRTKKTTTDIGVKFTNKDFVYPKSNLSVFEASNILFGSMREPTEDENIMFSQMLKRRSIETGVNIFNLL